MISLPPNPNKVFHSIKEFVLKEEIGKGAFSVVYKAKHKQTGKVYAIKKINLLKIPMADHENVRKEIQIHFRLRYKGIVKMIDFIIDKHLVYYVLEYCPYGNLYHYRADQGLLGLSEIKRIFRQICEAIKYLHDNDIILRDIKLENIVLDDRKNIKLIDFGWAAHLSDESYCKLRAGTFIYMSPESLTSQSQDRKSDIWALGVLLYELHFNKEPFYEQTTNQQLMAIRKENIKFGNRDVPNDVKELIKRIFRYNKEHRPTIDEILNSNYLKKEFVMVTPKARRKEDKLMIKSKDILKKANQLQSTASEIKSHISQKSMVNRGNDQIEYVKELSKSVLKQSGIYSNNQLTNTFCKREPSLDKRERNKSIKKGIKSLQASVDKINFIQHKTPVLNRLDTSSILSVNKDTAKAVSHHNFNRSIQVSGIDDCQKGKTTTRNKINKQGNADCRKNLFAYDGFNKEYPKVVQDDKPNNNTRAKAETRKSLLIVNDANVTRKDYNPPTISSILNKNINSTKSFVAYNENSSFHANYNSNNVYKRQNTQQKFSSTATEKFYIKKLDTDVNINDHVQKPVPIKTKSLSFKDPIFKSNKRNYVNKLAYDQRKAKNIHTQYPIPRLYNNQNRSVNVIKTINTPFPSNSYKPNKSTRNLRNGSFKAPVFIKNRDIRPVRSFRNEYLKRI